MLNFLAQWDSEVIDNPKRWNLLVRIFVRMIKENPPKIVFPKIKKWPMSRISN